MKFSLPVSLTHIGYSLYLFIVCFSLSLFVLMYFFIVVIFLFLLIFFLFFHLVFIIINLILFFSFFSYVFCASSFFFLHYFILFPLSPALYSSLFPLFFPSPFILLLLDLSLLKPILLRPQQFKI
jgi:hypothetical protein